MINEPWKLAELEPSAALDGRVRRRMRVSMRAAKGRAGAAPFFPFERTVYAVVLAVYALYAGARAVRLFRDARKQEVLPRVAMASPAPSTRIRPCDVSLRARLL
jgi:hypothetical protein